MPTILKSIELAAGAEVPEWVLLLPAGQVETTKGAFLVDDAAAAMILDAWRSGGRDLVFDYEHQTLGEEWASPDGTAPASGWIKELSWRGAEGLWARVDWTERAKRLIAAREYRFHSPVVRVRNQDGRVVEVRQAALTNDPAIKRLPAIVNKDVGTHEEDDGMKDRLITLLALAATATEEQVLEAVQALRDFRAGVAADLALKADAGLADARGAVLALRNTVASAPSAADFAALKKRLEERDVDELLAKAVKDHKLAPAMVQSARELALTSRPAFEAFLAAAPAIVPVGQVAGAGQPQKGPDGLDEFETQVCKSLGMTPEEFRKFKGEE